MFGGTSVNIGLEQESFNGGDEIFGCAILKVKKREEIHSLSVDVTGKIDIRLVERRRVHREIINAQGRLEREEVERNVYHTYSRILYNRVDVISNEVQTFGPGTHKLRFVVRLPEGLPPSVNDYFDGHHARIYYSINVYMPKAKKNFLSKSELKGKTYIDYIPAEPFDPNLRLRDRMSIITFRDHLRNEGFGGRVSNMVGMNSNYDPQTSLRFTFVYPHDVDPNDANFILRVDRESQKNTPLTLSHIEIYVLCITHAEAEGHSDTQISHDIKIFETRPMITTDKSRLDTGDFLLGLKTKVSIAPSFEVAHLKRFNKLRVKITMHENVPGGRMVCLTSAKMPIRWQSERLVPECQFRSQCEYAKPPLITSYFSAPHILSHHKFSEMVPTMGGAPPGAPIGYAPPGGVYPPGGASMGYPPTGTPVGYPPSNGSYPAPGASVGYSTPNGGASVGYLPSTTLPPSNAPPAVPTTVTSTVATTVQSTVQSTGPPVVSPAVLPAVSPAGPPAVPPPTISSAPPGPPPVSQPSSTSPVGPPPVPPPSGSAPPPVPPPSGPPPAGPPPSSGTAPPAGPPPNGYATPPGAPPTTTPNGHPDEKKKPYDGYASPPSIPSATSNGYSDVNQTPYGSFAPPPSVPPATAPNGYPDEKRNPYGVGGYAPPTSVPSSNMTPNGYPDEKKNPYCSSSTPGQPSFPPAYNYSSASVSTNSSYGEKPKVVPRKPAPPLPPRTASPQPQPSPFQSLISQAYPPQPYQHQTNNSTAARRGNPSRSSSISSLSESDTER